MADFGSPVAQNVDVNPMTSLSNLLSIKQKQQALQIGAQTLSADTAKAQQATQQNQELQALAAFTKKAATDPAYRNDDGSLNVQKFQNDAQAAAPVYGQAYIGQATSNANAMIDNRKALLSLSNDQRATIGNYFGSVAANPNADRDEFMDAVEQARGVSSDPQYQRAVDRMLMGAPQTHALTTQQSSEAIRQYARGIAMQTGAPDTNQSSPAVSMVQGDQGLVPTNTNPQSPTGVGPVGAPQKQGLPPGAMILEDAFHRQFVYDPQRRTVTPVGGGAPAGGGASGAPTSFQQPVADQQPVLQGIETARAIGDQGGTIRNTNQHLLQLSSDTKTGPGTQTVQKIAAFLGLPSGSQYQEIDAYLNRQAAMTANSMGVPHTNAGLAAAEKASGTTEYSPAALQEKVKFADALNSGAMAYRQGLDKAVGTGPAPDLTKYQVFRAAWAKNFDPDVYRAEDAQRRGDTAELEAIRKRVGTKGMAALAIKSANLRELENGVIPQ